MFVDEVILKVEAGRGGDGCLAFRREKFIPMGGPFGGNGGKGADIKFVVDEGLRTLIDLRYMKTVKGDKGENGQGKNQNGKNASDVIIKVPQGTIITDNDTGLILADLKEKNDIITKRNNERSPNREIIHRAIKLRRSTNRERNKKLFSILFISSCSK